MTTTNAPEGSVPVPALTSRGAASVDRSEVWTFTSALNQNDYRIFVSLPADYETSAKRYPVLYLLDGDSSWVYARGAVDRIGNDIASMIVVAVGYQGESQRWTDYGVPASSFWDIPADRGAPVFLRVLQEEVIPAIEGRYRADPSDRGLGGHSMGGFFAMWTLLTSPTTFQRYWISSPTVMWDGFFLRGLAESFSTTWPGLRARVYSDVGDLEDLRTTAEMEEIRRCATSGTELEWEHHVAPMLPHSGVPAVEIVLALYHLYGRPVAAVAPERLAAVSGEYAMPDATRFRLSTDGARLYLGDWRSEAFPFIPAPERTPLLAESDETFYLRMVGLEFRVCTEAGGEITQLSVASCFLGDPQPLGIATRQLDPAGDRERG